MAYSSSSFATGFTYITNSYDTPANAYLRKMIPEINVKNWSVELLCSIWGDILQRSLTLSKSIDERNVDQFLQGRCPNDQSLLAELNSIDEIVRSNAQRFPEVPEGKAAINAHKRLAKIAFIRSHFRPDDPNLTEQEKDVVRASRSSRPCHVIICDDVTANLRSPPNEEFDIPTVTEGNKLEFKRMKGKKGFEFLLVNLLTLTRHHAIVGFFVHTFDAFEPTIRGQFGGMMFMGIDSIEQACREKTISSRDMEIVRAAWDIGVNYPFHKVVLYTNPDMTDHKQRVALFRPTYHVNPKPIGVPTYQAVMRNIAMAIDEYRGGEIHRAQVQSEKQRLNAESEALAKEGASNGRMTLPQLPQLQLVQPQQQQQSQGGPSAPSLDALLA
jgi:hypothetical protein